MEYTKWVTLTGMTIADLRTALDKELPADAYTAIPGKSFLTDINPGYMKKCLNDVFGICGIGWGYQYSPDQLLFQAGRTDDYTSVQLKAGTFWFKMIDEGGQEQRIEITASGGSENEVMQFALKGALTNMIGNAVSQFGFQESVYMGKRSHKTTGTSEIKSGSNAPASHKRLEAAKSTVSAKPAAQQKAQPPTAEEYVVPKGTGIAPKHIGTRLSALSKAALDWYAGIKFTPADPAGEALKARCAQEATRRAAAAT